MVFILCLCQFRFTFYAYVTYNFPRSLCECLYRRQMGARDWRAMMRINWKNRKNDGTCLLLKQSDFNEVTNMNHNLTFDTFFQISSNLLASIFMMKVGFSMTTSQSPWTIGRWDNLRKFRNSGPQDCSGLIWSAFSCNFFSFILITEEKVRYFPIA